MARTRISTTVDSDLLDDARRLDPSSNDAQLIDAALEELLRSRRRAEVDAAYEEAYSIHPIDEPDEWGDLGAFRDAASAS